MKFIWFLVYKPSFKTTKSPSLDYSELSYTYNLPLYSGNRQDPVISQHSDVVLQSNGMFNMVSNIKTKRLQYQFYKTHLSYWYKDSDDNVSMKTVFYFLTRYIHVKLLFYKINLSLSLSFSTSHVNIDFK